MLSLIQTVYDHRAEILTMIIALDHALASTNKVRANSTAQLFLHAFVSSIQAQKAGSEKAPAEGEAQS